MVMDSLTHNDNNNKDINHIVDSLLEPDISTQSKLGLPLSLRSGKSTKLICLISDSSCFERRNPKYSKQTKTVAKVLKLGSLTNRIS